MELYQIVLLVIGILLLALIGVAYFTKKDYLKYSQLISPILVALTNVLKAVGNIFPTNKILAEVTTIFSAGIEAAGYAENLWLQGEIDKAMRPKYAEQYILILLEKAGITIDDSINAIVTGAIAVTCYLMPHYTEENIKEGEE